MSIPVTCPKCGHRMKVRAKGGPIRVEYCNKCQFLFCFTRKEMAVAEGPSLRSAIKAPDSRKPPMSQVQ